MVNSIEYLAFDKHFSASQLHGYLGKIDLQ